MNIYLERAKYTFSKIDDYKRMNASQNDQSKLKSYAKTVPYYIKVNGLLQTIAFLDVKRAPGGNADERAYEFLYQLVVDWLLERNLISQRQVNVGIPLAESRENLAEVLANMSLGHYKNVEREILELFSWVRRFAEGELG